VTFYAADVESGSIR